MSDNNEHQFKLLKSKANIQKEREKEKHYKSLFVDLMRKHKNDILLQSSSSASAENTNDYNQERQIIKKIMEVERESILGGTVVGVAAFLTVRYLPRFAVRMIGSRAKIRAMEEAESKQTFLKATGSLLFESTVGIWSAYRGYHLATSMRSGNVYDDIVSLPLCEGRSIVAETLCDEWQEIIQSKISPEFWENLNETQGQDTTQQQQQQQQKQKQQLNDPQFFKGVLEFHQACRKRKMLEDVLRQRDGRGPDEMVLVPTPGVPRNILEMTKEEIDAMFH